MKKQITISNIKAYIQGKIREKFYYSKRWNFIIPLHIYEQINYRLFVMDKRCLDNGECIECGCETPSLQMANKACLGACYLPMMNATDWHIHKREKDITFRYWGNPRYRNFELRITHFPKK